MLKKLLICTSFVLLILVGLHLNKKISSPSVSVAQADDILITPQLIEFFDDAGDPVNYNDWMEDIMAGSGVNPSNVGAWFGTYQFLDKGADKVYMAAGIGRPADITGAAMAKVTVRNNDPTEMTIEAVPVINREVNGEPIVYLEEDGLHEMDYYDENTIFIAGTDPAYGDGWDGNVYKLNTQTDEITKIRCTGADQTGNCSGSTRVFPDVIHFFGMSVLGSDIYVTGSRNPTGMNASDPVIYKSTDGGDTWEETWYYDYVFYRSKDIIAFKDSYQGVSRDQVYANLTYSSTVVPINNRGFLSTGTPGDPAGYDWTEMYPSGGRAPHTFVKGTLFNNVPIYVDYNGTSLIKFRMDTDGSYILDEIPLNGITIGTTNGSNNYYKHHAIVAVDDYLYVIADDNSIYKSNLQQPVTWQKVSSRP